MTIIEHRLTELQEEERALQAAAFQHQERAATVQASLNQEAARLAAALADVRRRIAECTELRTREQRSEADQQ